MKTNNDIQFVYSSHEKTIYCRTPLQFEVVVAYDTKPQFKDEVYYYERGDFFLQYNIDENVSLQTKMLSQIADWYYSKILRNRR